MSLLGLCRLGGYKQDDLRRAPRDAMAKIPNRIFPIRNAFCVCCIAKFFGSHKMSKLSMLVERGYTRCIFASLFHNVPCQKQRQYIHVS